MSLIRGRLHLFDGARAHRIVAFDRSIDGEVIVGDAITDPDGSFTIRYVPSHQKDRADLMVRAFAEDERVVAESELIIDARDEETVELVAGGGVYRGPSELERFADALAPHTARLPLFEWGPPELEYAASKTGIAREAIARLVTAAHLARSGEPTASAETYYAFLAAGLPADAGAIALQPARALEAILLDALRDGVLPARFEPGVEEIVARFEQRARARLGELFEPHVSDPAVRDRFIAFYREHGAADRSWPDALRFTAALVRLSDGYLPLIHKLEELRASGVIRDLDDLDRFGPTDWARLLDSIPGARERERLAKKLVAQAQPTSPAALVFAELRDAAPVDVEHEVASLRARLHDRPAAPPPDPATIADTREILATLLEPPLFDEVYAMIAGDVPVDGALLERVFKSFAAAAPPKPLSVATVLPIIAGAAQRRDARLDEAGFLAHELRLTAIELERFGWLSLEEPAPLAELVAYVKQRDTLGPGAELFEPAGDREETLRLFAERTRAKYEDLEYLAGPEGFALRFPEDFHSARAWSVLLPAIARLPRAPAGAETIPDRRPRLLLDRPVPLSPYRFSALAARARELAGHAALYQLAYDTAKQAERAYRFELGLDRSAFIHLDPRGDGERLLRDLEVMESSFLEKNRRDLELTKNISLAQHAPRALIELCARGRCELELSEELFDADYPDHEFRRLRSVTISVPVVTGPFNNVNCELALLSSAIRRGSELVRKFAPHRSIATSTGVADAGIFEAAGDRYLPFEGAGAHSRWRVSLPKETNRFDFRALTDVVLQVRYTARSGGERRRPRRTAFRLISARTELPAAWHQFSNPGPGKEQTLNLRLDAALFPRHLGAPISKLAAMELHISLKDGVEYRSGEVLVSFARANTPGDALHALELGRAGVPALAVDAPQLGDWTLSIKAVEEGSALYAPPDADAARVRSGQLADVNVLCEYELPS